MKNLEEDTQIIIRYWIRILNIKLGWINDFDKCVVNYVMFASAVFILDTFCSSSKLLNTFIGHTSAVWSIDYSTFGDDQFICSGSTDETVRVWDVNNNKQIQLFNKHSNIVLCVKFSQYHYYNNHHNVICSSSKDKTIHFWDFKHNKQLQVFNGHKGWIGGIEFSQFNCGCVRCLDISPLQDNNNNNINVIGGNGYIICSGSFDETIRICDIETTKQFNVFKGHQGCIMSVKYGSNELINTILSGSIDKSVLFNGHTSTVFAVEYSPFVIKNSICNSNVICSGSNDNTIRFWDIRSNKNELYLIKGDEEKDNGIFCLKVIKLKNRIKKKEVNDYCVQFMFGDKHTTIFERYIKLFFEKEIYFNPYLEHPLQIKLMYCYYHEFRTKKKVVPFENKTNKQKKIKLAILTLQHL
ncbi:mycorrhiza-induced NACHT/WD-repeat protein [Reticulomyxa filosa]|uniref:Mycorrhiza-induced NACHT/WD-repeat protein n=1 Tax=Reticulomyxa filosa TaxID=46433 RepID=X6MH65_RETFI|nr:mycorrhiza-induced NACHT/WD-repeat protein [Reticulomyxa filosa]|eukprot:ETO13239.1 mycorrhiza-induced NACHT/WD-repeat protein [Reticulomyxa filosa]